MNKTSFQPAYTKPEVAQRRLKEMGLDQETRTMRIERVPMKPCTARTEHRVYSRDPTFDSSTLSAVASSMHKLFPHEKYLRHGVHEQQVHPNDIVGVVTKPYVERLPKVKFNEK